MDDEACQTEGPELLITFVHKKSTQRVAELIREITSGFKVNDSDNDNTPQRCINLVENKPELLLSVVSQDTELKQDVEPPTNKAPKLASLKPFLFPIFPTPYQSNHEMEFDANYENTKQKFLFGARLEHHRLLYSFQDRLIRDMCNCDELPQQVPFQIVTQQLAKENILPITKTPEKTESFLTKFNNLMKKSQKEASALLDTQRRNANFFQDTKQFEINCKKWQNNEAVNPNEKLNDFSVVCPYSFLCSNSNNK
ncbi:hypothetical protein GPJ56_003464 [Histomonas meleagridis]|uniref:uncharacterized protein n=1 Tax=Histomonas meleagridis TaxID=135588 RepID=UPI0035597AC7|nr:hypothetical protein GPJ56_003464 [Histomonas meleagridis]KAH0799156.1 hypothetical protein GO595_007953 [Histomonas meleagridis]